MARFRLALGFVLAVALPALGDGVEGTWRIVPAGEGEGGLVRLVRDGAVLRYERRTRAGTHGPARLETGVAVPGGPVLRTTSSGESSGATGTLVGLSPAKSAAIAGRYLLGPRGWQGHRSGSPAGERWVRGSDRDTNDVQLLVDGPEAFPAIYQALGAARRSIDFQFYMFADDETGRRVGRILMDKARSGVRVRVLIDAASAVAHAGVAGTFKKPKRDWNGVLFNRFGLPTGKSKGLRAELREAGVEVITHHGNLRGIVGSLARVGDLFRGKRPRERRGFWNHDHRKVIVVDDRVGFTGGMNIGVEYEEEFHDVHCRVEGPAAHELHQAFVDRWRAAGGKGEADPAPRVAWTGDAPVEVVGSVPGLSQGILERYLREIERARERIQIEVAYFLDDRIIDALQRAVRRGVRVVLILPADEKNDVIPVREAFAAVHNEVVRSGIELWFFRPVLTHAKVAVFDGEVGTVGSANLDPLALDKLSELNLFVPDRRFAREMEERIFARDLPRSTRAGERKLGWWKRLSSGFFRLFRGII